MRTRHVWAVSVLAAALALGGCGDAAPPPAAPPRPAVVGAGTAQLPTYRVIDSESERGPLMQPIVALVPSDDAAITDALAAGVRCAFSESGAAGGPALELRISTRTAAWGSIVEGAIREAVDADAVALVTPPERRHTHLLLQLATKVRLPMFSTSPAHSALSSGSPWIVAVVPTADGVTDAAPTPPAFDPRADSAGRFVADFRAANGRDPGPWEAAGYDAGRCVVEGVRRNGLHRNGLLGALVHGAPIHGASGDFSFDRDGARASGTAVSK